MRVIICIFLFNVFFERNLFLIINILRFFGFVGCYVFIMLELIIGK